MEAVTKGECSAVMVGSALALQAVCWGSRSDLW
jgi:hypothetical protein